jgi:gamma-glutamylcyclotransferase (GGCT)/AIG2-like uncharacterized protein YtfP
VRAGAVVIGKNGARQHAWIYWLGTRIGAARRIASGDWMGSRRSSGGAHG